MEYRKVALSNNLIVFLNLDFNNFNNFFIYLDKMPQDQLSKIFKGFNKNVINIGPNKPIHIANNNFLKNVQNLL